jgi:hypothetical protein
MSTPIYAGRWYRNVGRKLSLPTFFDQGAVTHFLRAFPGKLCGS